MNDAEKIRHLADVLKWEGYALLSVEAGEVADRIETLERLVAEMVGNAIVWNDDDTGCYCVHCESGDCFEDRIVHGADCPVSVARRLGVVK